MKYSKKNLERLIRITKPCSVKRLIYVSMYLTRFFGISIEELEKNNEHTFQPEK